MSIVIKNLSKSFHQGDTLIGVLDNISLAIESGELVAVLGSSGSGKSTLLGILAGLDEPDSGEILIHGVNLYQLSDRDRTRQRVENISLVFQQFHLLPHLTALENVQLALEILGRPDLNKARSMLEQMQLGSRLQHFPSQMSGGECQRVAIARALVTNPKLLLADEPSGNLDAKTAATVMDQFFHIVKSQKMTCILVTHNEELAKRCDRTLRLEGGRL